jgi:tetratricopeptide (TPR) repeat protein
MEQNVCGFLISSNLRARAIGILLAVACLAAATANSQLDHARALRRLGKLAEARTVLDGMVADAAAPSSVRAQAFFEISQIDLAEGRYAAAIQQSGRAIELFRAGHDPAGEGNTLTVRGLAHLYAGSYSEALADFNPALQIARETKDASAEVTRLNNIGTVFYFEGDYGNAAARYEAAMRVVEEHRTEPWNTSRRQLTVANIATVHQRLGQFDRALDAYGTLRRAANALPPSEEAQVLANMGALYRRLGDPDKALETYRAAQGLYQSQAMRNGEIAVLNNIGIAQALDLRLYPEALATFDKALAMAQESGDRPVEVHALLYRAETMYRMGRAAESGAGFVRAYGLATRIRAAEERWKSLYGLARNDAESGNHSAAVSRLEEAAGLIESLRGSGPANMRGGFLADKRQVYDLLMFEELRDPAVSDSKLFSIIEQTHSRLAQDAKKESASPSLESLRRTLPRGTLILDYWLGEDAAVVLWVKTDTAGLKRIDDASGLRTRLRSFAASLADVKSNSWKEEGRRLGEKLLPNLPGAEEMGRVIVIPDRELAFVPFETLSLPGDPTHRLIDVAAVSYARAASLVVAMPWKRQIWPFWKSTILAFANPTKGSGADILNLPFGRDAAPLQEAGNEVRDAARAIGGRAQLHLGPDARKEFLTGAALPLAPVLHFATHAVSDAEDPARSFILLAPQHPRDAYDYLFLKEASGLNLRNVDLVTVSACDTARGKLVEGESTESFGGAFLDAGAKVVVASLWQVGDRATSRLMHGFYSGLANGDSVAAALRQAKLKSEQSHPYYWASFTATGDGEVRVPYVVSGLFSAAALLAVIGIAILGIAAWRSKSKRQT